MRSIFSASETILEADAILVNSQDAMRSLLLIGEAVFEFDYFNAGDHRQCLDTAGCNDINIHFFNVNAVPQGRPCPELGPGFPAGTSIGPSSRTRS